MTTIDFAIQERSPTVVKILYDSGMKITNPLYELYRILNINWRPNYNKKMNDIIVIITNGLSDYKKFHDNWDKYILNKNELKERRMIFEDIIKQLPEKNDFIIGLKLVVKKRKTINKFKI